MKHKHLISQAVSLLLTASLACSLLTGISAGAQTDAQTGFTYRLHTGQAGATGGIRRAAAEPQAEITAYSGSDTDVTIPGVIDGHEVTSIGKAAFKGNTDITGVTIADSITSIGYEAFAGCTNLARVSLPATVTNWNDTESNSYQSYAFMGCTALTELTLPEGLTSLGQRAFMGCTALDNVTIPSTIETFRDEVFSGCSALKNLEIKEGVRQIGYKAFEGCTSLEQVRIPSTIEGWGLVHGSGVMATTYDCAPFLDCTSLRQVTFAEGLQTLQGFQGVRGCPLVETLEIPGSVENIDYAFRDCAYLKTVTLGRGIQSIGASAFENCTALQQTNIPNTVTAIGAKAYSGCASLERLVMPPSVTQLAGSPTAGCTNLSELYLLADTVGWYQALGLASDGKLYCVEGSSTYGTYQAGMSETARQKLTPVPSAEIQAQGYTAAYDGNAHDAVTLQGAQNSDQIWFLGSDGAYTQETPQITEPGSHSIQGYVLRETPDGPYRYSTFRVNAAVTKRQHSLHISDTSIREGETYTVAVEGYEGEETPVYTYYQDAACTKALSGKPETAGVYYVRATVAETAYDAAAESNTAKITIQAKGSTGADSGTAAGNNTGTNTGGSRNTNGSQKQVKVKKVTLTKVKATGKKALAIRWKKVSPAAGYQIQLATNKKFTKGKKSCLVKKAKTMKKTVKKLKKKKTYYVRVCAYRVVQGKRYYGAWSKVKKAKVK